MEKLKPLVARILDVDESEITDDSSPQTIESWDSFNGLMMVAELEKNFNVKFTMDEVMAVEKFADIKAALERHNVKEY